MQPGSADSKRRSMQIRDLGSPRNRVSLTNCFSGSVVSSSNDVLAISGRYDTRGALLAEHELPLAHAHRHKRAVVVEVVELSSGPLLFLPYVVIGRRDYGAVSGSIRAQSVPGLKEVNEKACRNLLSRQALSFGATGFEPSELRSVPTKSPLTWQSVCAFRSALPN